MEQTLEIAEEAGFENEFIFGLKADEIEQIKTLIPMKLII